MMWPFKNNKYKLNCRGSSPSDCRDFCASTKPTDKRQADWRKYCRLIENQGQTSSCVAQGDEAMVAVPINILRGSDYQNAFKMVDLDAFDHYKDICDTFYQGNQKNGSYPRDGMKRLQERGIYEISPQAGKLHKISRYFRCLTVSDAENAIVTTAPVTAALKVYQSFYKSKGVVALPTKFDFFSGYHQVCLVARISRGDEWGFILRNSWGNVWGDMGYAFISDKVLETLAVEMWCGEYDCTLEDIAILADRITA